MRKYYSAWFKTKEEARNYKADKIKKERIYPVMYYNTRGSTTKTEHLFMASMFGFDPKEYPYSVNWWHTV